MLEIISHHYINGVQVLFILFIFVYLGVRYINISGFQEPDPWCCHLNSFQPFVCTVNQ